MALRNSRSSCDGCCRIAVIPATIKRPRKSAVGIKVRPRTSVNDPFRIDTAVRSLNGNGRLRRVSPIAARSGDRLLSEPSADTQPWGQELVLMPLSSHSRSVTATMSAAGYSKASHSRSFDHRRLVCAPLTAIRARGPRTSPASCGSPVPILHKRRTCLRRARKSRMLRFLYHQARGHTLMPSPPQYRQRHIWAYQPRPNSSKPSCRVSSPQSWQKWRNRSRRSRSRTSPRHARFKNADQSSSAASILCQRLKRIPLGRPVR